MSARQIKCYRICLWDGAARRWRPVCTRTRTLFRILRPLLRRGVPRSDIHVEIRPGRLIPMPLPPPKGLQLRLVSFIMPPTGQTEGGNASPAPMPTLQASNQLLPPGPVPPVS
jgi:hypothetical protein